MIDTIEKWIKNLIEGKELPLSLISPKFCLEDGMTLDEYWSYEKNSFDSYSSIFDLDNNFSVNIFHVHKLSQYKTLCFIYVLNKYNKIAFKMTITINSEGLIDSNEFNAQIVPKYSIEDGKIKELGMAIKSRFELEDVICPEFKKLSFSKGSNFDDDLFYNVKFECFEIQNRAIVFYLKFKGVAKPEKRVVYFDQLNIEDCPYEINKETIFVVNDKYPVNLALFLKDGTVNNFVYPRNVSQNINILRKAIVTDVLDNDWIINFESN